MNTYVNIPIYESAYHPVILHCAQLSINHLYQNDVLQKLLRCCIVNNIATITVQSTMESNMYQITFIVPYPELVRDVEEVFQLHPMHSRLRKRVEVIGAEELDRHYPDLARTSDVLVARGYTAQRLKGFNPTIPVVTLPISSYDIIRAVEECIRHYHPSRIALIGLMVDRKSTRLNSSH